MSEAGSGAFSSATRSVAGGNRSTHGSFKGDDEHDAPPPPQSVPFVTRMHQDFRNFHSDSIHCICVVQKAEMRMLNSLFAGDPKRVAIVSPNSLFLCDQKGPVKRLIKLHLISSVYTQVVINKSGVGVTHVLVKVPTEHDILLAMVEDERNDPNTDFLKTLGAAWAVDRYEREGESMVLPVFPLTDDEKITDPQYLQLKDFTADGAGAKQKCKACLAKDRGLMVLQEKMVDLYNKLLASNEQVSQVGALKQKEEKLKFLTAQANAGRQLYREKCKQLLLTLEEQQKELDDWREFAEALVKQTQLLNTPPEHYRALCHPHRVAQLEQRLEKAAFYKELYENLKEKWETAGPDGGPEDASVPAPSVQSDSGSSDDYSGSHGGRRRGTARTAADDKVDTYLEKLDPG